MEGVLEEDAVSNDLRDWYWFVLAPACRVKIANLRLINAVPIINQRLLEGSHFSVDV